MISKITGTVAHIDLRYAIIDVNGVGYKVFLTNDALEHVSHAKDEGSVSLWTYLAVREDALDLYGFKTRDEQDFFELLISISGIGPKSAIGILSNASIDTLKEAIYSGDPSYLTKVAGVGRKSAEKIVLELKDKFGTPGQTEATITFKEGMLAVEGLKALGFGEREAREAVKKVGPSVKKTTDIIKEALKLLGQEK